MEGVREYLFSIIAAAMIAGIVLTIVGKKGTPAAVIKLMVGLLLVTTIFSPWAELQIGDLSTYFENLQHDASAVADEALRNTKEEEAAIIKKEIEAYILDKAVLLDLDVSANISLTDSDPPEPYAVTITGIASPYAKQRLQHIISSDLGIPKEQQSWISND